MHRHFWEFIIPENADAQKVLDLFREKQNYLAVVVDEYGSFEGIITLHDIIENIIGNVPEEGELPEPEVFVREDQSVLVSGDAPIETLVDLIEDFSFLSVLPYSILDTSKPAAKKRFLMYSRSACPSKTATFKSSFDPGTRSNN